MDTAVIKIHNITYNYTEANGFRKKIANKVSFEIESGKITAFLGNDKLINTFFLKIIADLIKPDSGKIITNKKTVFIPSAPSSFPWLNVKDNIIYNLKNYDEKVLTGIIQIVGLSGYENHLPHNNSYGFRFRISVARALMDGADVLILDEPFALMNSLSKKETQELLQKINSEKGITVILTSSDVLEMIKIADNIVAISNDKNVIVTNNSINNEARTEIISKLHNKMNK